MHQEMRIRDSVTFYVNVNETPGKHVVIDRAIWFCIEFRLL